MTDIPSCVASDRNGNVAAGYDNNTNDNEEASHYANRGTGTNAGKDGDVDDALSHGETKDANDFVDESDVADRIIGREKAEAESVNRNDSANDEDDNKNAADDDDKALKEHSEYILKLTANHRNRGATCSEEGGHLAVGAGQSSVAHMVAGLIQQLIELPTDNGTTTQTAAATGITSNDLCAAAISGASFEEVRPGAVRIHGIDYTADADTMSHSTPPPSDGAPAASAEQQNAEGLVSAYLVTDEGHNQSTVVEAVAVPAPTMPGRRQFMALAALLAVIGAVVILVVLLTRKDDSNTNTGPPISGNTAEPPSPTSAPTLALRYTQFDTDCGEFHSIASMPNSVVLGNVSGCTVYYEHCTEFVTLPRGFNWFGDTIISEIGVTSSGQINIDNDRLFCNHTTANPFVVGGTYTRPRIAVVDGNMIPGFQGNILTVDTGSSFIVSWEGVSLEYYATVNAQVELYPNGDVALRWGNIGSDLVSPAYFSAGLEDETRQIPEAFPAVGAPFDDEGVTVVDATSLGPRNQCRIFRTFFESYTESSSKCSSFERIANLTSARKLESVSDCSNATGCHEVVTLPFDFSWFSDEMISNVSITSNGQINMDGFEDALAGAGEDVKVGGHLRPRIAVASDNLNVFDGLGVYTLDTGTSFIVSWEYHLEAQVEVFANGDVEIRWGSNSAVNPDPAAWIAIAAGLEDDTRAIPEAVPATGYPFNGSTGVTSSGYPTNQCRRFSVSSRETPQPAEPRRRAPTWENPDYYGEACIP